MGDVGHAAYRNADTDDVGFAPASNQRINSRRNDHSQTHLHPNSFVNTFSTLNGSGLLHSSDMHAEAAEEARTVEYLERVGDVVRDERTCAEKLRDKAKQTCGKARVG